MRNFQSPAAILQRLTADLSVLMFDLRVDAASTEEAERRIAEGERIAAAIRLVFRG